jgi:hypothetical protein
MGAGLNRQTLLRPVQNSPEPFDYAAWCCGRCAEAPKSGSAPVPSMRVCPISGLGLLLETRAEPVATSTDAFIVADSGLAIEAVSVSGRRHAETRSFDAPLTAHRLAT